MGTLPTIFCHTLSFLLLRLSIWYQILPIISLHSRVRSDRPSFLFSHDLGCSPISSSMHFCVNLIHKSPGCLPADLFQIISFLGMFSSIHALSSSQYFKPGSCDGLSSRIAGKNNLISIFAYTPIIISTRLCFKQLVHKYFHCFW